jgi:hypothetical protein
MEKLNIAEGDPLADSELVYPVNGVGLSVAVNECDDPDCGCVNRAVVVELHFRGGQVLQTIVDADVAGRVAEGMLNLANA